MGVMDAMVFAGHRNDVPALLAATDVLCISSNYEGTPLVLFEAMATLDAVSAAAGTPIRAEVERMLEATAEALAACIEGADAMQPKFGE